MITGGSNVYSNDVLFLHRRLLRFRHGMGDPMSKSRRSSAFKKGYSAALRLEENHRDLAPRLKRFRLLPLHLVKSDQVIDRSARRAVEGRPLRWENHHDFA